MSVVERMVTSDPHRECRARTEKVRVGGLAQIKAARYLVSVYERRLEHLRELACVDDNAELEEFITRRRASDVEVGALLDRLDAAEHRPWSVQQPGELGCAGQDSPAVSSEQCPFCAIVAGDDPDVREVYRNEHVVAFFPTEPAVLGHVLVVPKRHVQDIWGLRPEESAELSTAAMFLSTALRSALLPEGLNVIQSNGEAATQTVPHLHVHLVPRRNGDAMGPIWPPETDYTEASKDDALRRVRAAVQSTPPPAQPELSPEVRPTKKRWPECT